MKTQNRVLIKQVAAQIGKPIKDVTAIIDLYNLKCVNAIIAGERVDIANLGQFKKKLQPATTKVNPNGATLPPLIVPAKMKISVYFKAEILAAIQ